MKIKTQISSFVLMLTAIGLVAGCASTGQKRRNQVESSVESTRTGLESANAAISETLATLGSLQLESTVLTEVYPVFKKQVKAVADGAEQVKKNSIAMQEAGKVKFDTWKLELESIQDAKLKKTSMKRMEDALKSYEDLLALVKESETVMDPFVSDLTDIVTYLDLDLTKEGIKKISGFNGPVKKATKSGEKVQKWIGKVVEELVKAEGEPAV